MSKIKKSLLAFTFLIAAASILSAFSPLVTPVAHAALTPAQIQECYTAYNGKRFGDLTVEEASSALYRTCVTTEKVCISNSPGAPIACQTPGSAGAGSAANLAKAQAAEIAPILTAVCGAVPVGGAALDIYNACAQQAQIVYDDCSYPNSNPSNPTSGTQNSAAATAQCATSRFASIPGSKRPNQAQVAAAVTSGRDAYKKVLADAETASSKEECESQGGTWENNQCTPKDANEPVCSGGPLGWVLCPAADLVVKATNFFAEWTGKFLTFTPLLNSDQGRAIQAVWQLLINIANILLVIAFLVVVFSQATSIGLSSYGIKKMLPKIIAAAILMNLSFFICALAVDISNILGQSVAGVVQVGINALPDPGTGIASDVKKASDGSGFMFGAILAVVLGAGLVAAGQIFAVLPIILSALAVVLTAFLLILFRQVAIVILIILSPLAFVAWVLPNTESWFTRWRKLFFALLLMFPLIMGIFYGASFLSNVMVLTLDQGNTPPERWVVQIAALGVLVAPLFALPFVMKSVGGILDRFGVAINNRNRGLIDRSKKWADENNKALQDRQKSARLTSKSPFNRVNPLAMNARRVAKRDHQRKLAHGFAEEGEQEYLAHYFNNEKRGERRSERFARGAGAKGEDGIKGGATAIQASAQATVDKLDRESIERRQVLMRAQNDPRELLKSASTEFEKAVNNGDAIGARAASNIMLTGGTKGLEMLAKSITTAESNGKLLGDEKDKIGKQLRDDVVKSGLKPKENALATWSFTKGTLEQRKNDAGTYSGLSRSELAGQSEQNIRLAGHTGAVTAQTAKEMLESDSLAPLLNPEKRAILQRVVDQQPQVFPASQPPANPVSASGVRAVILTPNQPAPAPAATQGTPGPAGGGQNPGTPGPAAPPNQGQQGPLAGGGPIRMQAAQQQAAQAAQGTSGTTPFVVSGTGTTASSSRQARAQDAIDNAQAGTSGSQAFSVSSSGEANQTISPSAPVTRTDSTGAPIPGDGPDDTNDRLSR